MRRSLLLTIVVLVTGAQSAMAADALPEVSNTDRYILRNLFTGSLDLFSPIGKRGTAIRTAEDLWVVSPLSIPPHPDNTPEVNTYCKRTVCFWQAFDAALNPKSETYDANFETLYAEANTEVVKTVKQSATMAELRDATFAIFEKHGLLQRLVGMLDPSCEPVPIIAESMRKMNEYLDATPGVRGRESFSGPNEPCAILRYCNTPEGPTLVYDLGSSEKQLCYDIHTQLLDDKDYYRAYALASNRYQRKVANVTPDKAPEFLCDLYEALPKEPFFIQLLAAYEKQRTRPADAQP